MITTAVTWAAVASWISAAAVLLADHVAKVAIPEDLIIATVGIACTLVVVRAVLSLKSPSRDYHEGWLACRRSIEREVARERERMAAPLP
jgi:uncharacterized membrane protein YgaE (UPF0421/DUF939 family)